MRKIRIPYKSFFLSLVNCSVEYIVLYFKLNLTMVFNGFETIYRNDNSRTVKSKTFKNIFNKIFNNANIHFLVTWEN